MKNIFIGTGSGSEHKICAYQSTIVYNFFLVNGYNLVKCPKDADLLVINGYPFEEFEERINLMTIAYYLAKYPNKEILLIGSIPAMMPYMADVKGISMIGFKELSKFDDKFAHEISINDIQVDNVKYFIPLNIESLNIDHFGYSGDNIESKVIFSEKDYNFSISDFNDENYDISKIQEYDCNRFNYLNDISGEYPIEICTGCSGGCSYCDIKNISGFVKSVPLDTILNKIKRGLSLGYNKFHFIDEDSASYGLDIGTDFAHLLNEICKIEGDFKLKIFYFEPGRLEKLFTKIDKDVWKRIINFCLPLQTTSQRILKLMNRNYNIKNVLDIVDEIRKENKEIFISTQFIYGFPSETFEEFADYFRMIKHFDNIWFYYYSDRKGTRSVDFPLKISKKELSKRMVFLWKIKEKYIDRVFDKNQSLTIGLNIIKARKF